MVTYEWIAEAHEILVNNWHDRGKAIIVECIRTIPFNQPYENFLEYCTACGGDWSGMILTGIKDCFPRVWELIPNKMGKHSWACLNAILTLCGVGD